MTTIKLKNPIKVDGAEVAELNMRRPKVRDLERMDKAAGGQMAQAIALVGDLTELTPDQVREIDGEDFIAISKMLGDFLEGAPATSGA